jgi:hypothetical protein
MPDIIQQLLDLKEWSQDSARYERRLNFRSGQLVQPGPGRQGYAKIAKRSHPQEYIHTTVAKKTKEAIEMDKVWDRKTRRFRKRLVPSGPPVLDKKQQTWFNERHFNNPKSKYHKIKWGDKKLVDVRANILEEYANTLKYPKIPKNYITTLEYARRYNLPMYETGVTQELDIIGNQLKRITLPSGTELTPTRDFLFDKLKPKKFTTDRTRWYVRDDSKIAKEVVSYFDKSQLEPHTMDNIKRVLRSPTLKKLFNDGNYKELVSALKKTDWLGPAEKANVMLRISQVMGGASFRNFDPKIERNSRSATKLFKGLEGAQWGDPFSDAYKALKRSVITRGIGREYFIKSYGTFVNKAIENLNAAGIDTRALKLDINELTGLTSAYKNEQFTSSQFINLMSKEFNRNQHATMIKQYGKFEKKLQSALKHPLYGETAAQQVIEDWKTWRKGWYDKLDPQYKTKGVRDILPSFKLGEEAAVKQFGKKRLNQLLDLGLDVADEAKTAGYLKTFGSAERMKTTPVLKELVNNPNASIKLLKSLKFRCVKDLGGVEDVACYLRDARSKLKLVNRRGPGFQRILARLRNVGKKTLLWGFGPLDLVIEALFAAHGVASGHGKDQIWADSLLGMIIPQSLGGPKWGDKIRLEKIAAKGGEEYVHALKQEQEFDNILDQYYDVDKIPGDLRGQDTTEYKEKLYADLDKVWEEYAARQEKDMLTVPEEARPSETFIYKKGTDEEREITSLGPRDKIMKWSQDLNPDSFAAEKFRIASEKLEAEEAALGQATQLKFPKKLVEYFPSLEKYSVGIGKPRLETRETERIRKTKDIAEHPRGEDYWTEFFRTLRGWDPAWMGPEGTGFSFRHEVTEPGFAGGGIAGLSGGKRFGPPPLSGPVPQGEGLFSQFNRVKKLTG